MYIFRPPGGPSQWHRRTGCTACGAGTSLHGLEYGRPAQATTARIRASPTASGCHSPAGRCQSVASCLDLLAILVCGCHGAEGPSAVGGQPGRGSPTGGGRRAAHGRALVPIRMQPACLCPSRHRTSPASLSIRPPASGPVVCGMVAQTPCSQVQPEPSPSPHLWGARLTAIWSGRAIEAETWMDGGRYSHTVSFLFS